ncbi:MAG TPA: DUF4097 family beta strand repeat-containing protein [Thermomicrobiales bacterium]|nr:DUF4097 family beta strand repeat-containing protein [Thermomicrobiales bacterium]
MSSEQPFTVTNDGMKLETDVSFNADAPLTLSASNASGRVDITTDVTLPAGTVRVSATRTDGGGFEQDDHHFTVKADGNSISVHPDWQFASGVSGIARRIRDQLQHGFRPEDWNLSRLKLSPELDFNISIALPASLRQGSQIKVRTASGEVSASDIAASTSIVTASGDVDARDLTGTVAIHTASGDVEVDSVKESLEINTASGDVSISGGDAWLAARSASGDVSIRGMAMRNSRITTVSGDITLDAIFNNAANYGMETVSGDVDLRVALPANDATATLGFGTLSGSSKVDPDWQQRKRREWYVGDGDTRISINVKTVSGDLSARARLDTTVEAREIELPSHTPVDDAFDTDFREEMKSFGEEMKRFGREMKQMTHHDHPTAPVPPTPADAVPPVPPTPPAGPHHAGHSPDHTHLFTTGPSGHDYRHRASAQAQPTEPVSPPEPFTDAPDDQPSEAEIIAMETSETPTTPETTTEPRPTDSRDERIRVLEALEKGEIDIEDALAQLEANNDKTQ